MRLALTIGLVAIGLSAGGAQAAAHRPMRNVILFVADGLRSEIVTDATAPTLARVRREGVDFRNSHALFPTVTTANASAFATGHGLGDTGDFGNSLWIGFPLASLNGSRVAVMENDAVLRELGDHYGGSYLGEETLLAAARRAGYATAAVGKLGPVLVQDVGDKGPATLTLDDRSGAASGPPLAPGLADAIRAAGLAFPGPGRGENDRYGDAFMPGTHTANVAQGGWFAQVAARVILPRFAAEHRPFAMVFWSRDPDGSQHNQGDSLQGLTPGINGATSLAGIRNADNALAALLEVLKRTGLDRTTDVIVTADHGFSTISKESRTSPAARITYADTPPGHLPPGFLAIDLALALDLPLSDTAGRPIDWRAGRHAAWGDGLLGDPAAPRVVVTANGGADLIYLPQESGRAKLARRIVQALWTQDYTGGVFTRDALGPVAGALPMSAVGLVGSALTPSPDIVVSFRSFDTGCGRPELCAAEVADTSLQQGQGIHGSLSRANTHNFMAAAGPDFRSGFVDPAPASNADVGRTLFALLGLKPSPRGRLRGRVLGEALQGGPPVRSAPVLASSMVTAAGDVTVVKGQRVGGETYYDAAGQPGRVVGLTR